MSLSAIIRALSRARPAILSFAVIYFLSVLVGAVMVHTGNEFALTYRDDLVGRAQASDPAMLALGQNERLRAALFDFGGNLQAGIGQTVAGLGVIFPYPIAAFHGWVGGIVSVNSAHVSRLASPSEAVYYLSVMILQLIPYTLAAAAGVTLGFACFRPPAYYQGQSYCGCRRRHCGTFCEFIFWWCRSF
jgi:hypothetical protein